VGVLGGGAWVWELGSGIFQRLGIKTPSANHLQIFIFEEVKKGGRKGFRYLSTEASPLSKTEFSSLFFLFKER
jgi:hypothetical protein